MTFTPPPPLEFDDPSELDDPTGDSFWSEGIYYVWSETEGDFVEAPQQPDPPGVFRVTPDGRVVPA